MSDMWDYNVRGEELFGLGMGGVIVFPSCLRF